MTPAQQKEAIRRRAQGATLQELGDSYDRGKPTMRRATRNGGLPQGRLWLSMSRFMGTGTTVELTTDAKDKLDEVVATTTVKLTFCAQMCSNLL
jgi:hypothetical protein